MIDYNCEKSNINTLGGVFMKKSLVMVLVLLMVAAVVSAASAHVLVVVGPEGKGDTITTGRTVEDYKVELKKLSGADEVGDVIAPERNEVKYLFVPLYKGGELIGYGSWVNMIIYNHPEDMIAYVSPDKQQIVKFAALDANDHHPEMKDEEYIGKFFGMTLDRDFDSETDVIAGSTYSVNTMFFEMKNILLTAQNYLAE